MPKVEPDQYEVLVRVTTLGTLVVSANSAEHAKRVARAYLDEDPRRQVRFVGDRRATPIQAERLRDA